MAEQPCGYRSAPDPTGTIGRADPPASENDTGRRKDRRRIDIESTRGLSASPSSGARGHVTCVGPVQADLDRQAPAGWANLIARPQTALALLFPFPHSLRPHSPLL